MFESPRSYYSLQEPNRIPEFYGRVKLTQNEAVKVAHQTIKNLGYTDATFYADRVPSVTPPPHIKNNYIPRYLVAWTDFYHDPDPDPRISPTRSIEMEVDATTGQIQMLHLLRRNVQKPDPVIGFAPPVVAPPPQSEPIGGRKITPFSLAYSNAFLKAILPQLTDFAKKANVNVKLPIATSDIDMRYNVGGFVENDPIFFMYLKTGDRFVYGHGQVVSFETHDSTRIPEPNKGLESKPREIFFGQLNMTTNEAVVLAKKTFTNLGYSLKAPGLDKPLRVAPPIREGTNYYARIFVSWWDREIEMDVAEVEFDATTKQLKSFYINDHAIPSIWREPPKIDLMPKPKE